MSNWTPNKLPLLICYVVEAFSEWILQNFPEFYELFSNFSQNNFLLFFGFIFLLSCRTEVSDPNNSEFLISPN